MNRYLLAVVVLGCSDPSPTTQTPPAELIGRIEVSADVPAGNCQVLLEGSPLGARCDGAGSFDIANVIPGRWDLRVISDLELPSRRVAAAANSGFVTDLGAIRLAAAGAIGGHVIGNPDGIVVVPAFGIVTAPNANGGYLLSDVPPGVHEIVFVTPLGTVTRGGITVQPGKATIQIDLDAATALGGTTEIDGNALRAHAADDGNGGLTVELLDASTGVPVATATTTDNGAFTMVADPGIYVIRARDGDSPITAVIPSVVPHGNLPFHLASPLVVFPLGGDLDGDGIGDDKDPDIDNDGVANDADAFPFDPAETADIDGDGLGDRADLATHGVDLDTHTPTPDTDGDGRLDFEDDCKLIADPAQADADHDGVGDACDNCVLVANNDQADSAGNGVGDACRACSGNESCPLDQTCQQGKCVQCTTSAQCGGKVCVDGGCVACSATQACDVGLCNVPVGSCQECIVNQDCGAGAGCVAGHCFAGCNGDQDCGGSFCVGHVCAECRGNADCPSTQYCDAGLCQPECSVNQNCSGGRICDQATRTCELPCGTGCPSGQQCAPDNTCQQICDLTFPCPGGQICDQATATCGPACTFDTDCTGFDVCQLGECVPSGACGLDTDCSASEMCGSFGACIARPTAFDSAAGAFTCSTACDCKLGETCDTGHCVADGVPTRFVAPGAAGNGLSINSPTGSLQTGTANLVANDLVAIRTGTVTVSGAPSVIAASNTRVQGGYVACNATRWVRDAAQPSKLDASGSGVTILSVGHNFAALTSNVVIRGLRLGTPVNGKGVDASFAPNLLVEDIVLEPNAGSTGIFILASSGVVVDTVSLPSFDGFVTLEGIKLDTSAGIIRHITFGTVTGVVAFNGIDVVAATGPVTIDDVSSGLWSYFNETNVILVDNTPLTNVTVTNGHFSAVSAPGNGSWAAIHARDSADVRVSDSTLDGTGFIDPDTGPNAGHWSAVWFENSAGTIDRVSVSMPQITSIGTVTPFFVLGPEGGVTISDCTVTGRGGPTTHMIGLEDVTDSTTVIRRGSYSSTQTGTGRSDGLFADNSAFVLTDAAFQLPGTALEVYGFELVNGATGRIERSRFQTGGVSTVTNRAVGGHVTDASSLELYDSWLVGGAPTKILSGGIWLEKNYTFRAIGNTIEGGGSAGQPGESNGVLCQPNAGLGQALWSSNIIDGGLASNHFMVHDATVGSSCSIASSWDHAYFAFRATGVRNATALEVADNIAAGGVANQIHDGLTCFADTTFAILGNSACIDAGVAGTRLDTTPLLTDLLGNPRVVGAADIGAQEHP